MENKEIQFQINVLERDGYHAAADIIRTLIAEQWLISRKSEFQWLKQFVKENIFDGELGCDQLRGLWTAYCLHHRLDVDTSGYDNDLLELWNSIEEPLDNVFFSDYEGFDNFMCRYLC